MLISLWLPIVLCTAVLFLLSFLFWAVSPHHKPDVRQWPDEEALLEFVRRSDAQPQQYMFPLIAEADYKNPDAIERYNNGPWGMLVLWPAKSNMAMNMIKTVTLLLVITCTVAYVGLLTLPAGTSFAGVFHVIGIVAVLAHTTGGMLNEVWFSKPLRAKAMNALDGVVYGLVTALLMAWLWP
ncbi:MAG: hypothetical protein AAGH65_06960 [Pseudomonadota bacterium]